MADTPTIVQFESDDFYSTTLDLVFYNMGLKDPIKVTNKEEVRSMIKKIESGKQKIDVAIIDTYIGINNEDGKKIAEKIRKVNPNAKIIGYSIMPTDDWADYSMIKSMRDQENTIVKVMEEVLGKKFNYSETDDPEYINNSKFEVEKTPVVKPE